MMAEEKYFLSIKADEINDVLVRASTKPVGAQIGNFPVFSSGRDLADSGRNTDSYALALKTTDGPAASIDIYPDEGSNIIVAAYGYTEQDGSGDPSPENVRPVKVGGIKLVKVTFDGTESWATRTSDVYGIYFYVTLPVPAIPKQYKVYCDNFPGSNVNTNPEGAVYTSSDGLSFTVVPKVITVSSLDEWKSYLSKNPLTIWYPPNDPSQYTGLYSPIVMNGIYSKYQSPCISLHGGLCDGSYAKNDGSEYVKDEIVELTGDEEWSIATGSLIKTKIDFPTSSSVVKCSHGKYAFGTDAGSLFAYITEEYSEIRVNPTGGQFGDILSGWTSDTLISMWKAWLKQQYNAGTPMQVIMTRKEPTVYSSNPIHVFAMPDSTGKVVVSGEKTVSATYNKSLSHALSELQSAIIALGASMQGGL